MKNATAQGLAVVLLSLSALPACSGGSGGDGSGGGIVVPSRTTPNYLLTAIDTSNFFRWTKRPGDPDIRVYIEVWDQSLPSAERDAYENWIVKARGRWKAAVQGAGVNINSYTRFLSRDAPFPASTAVLRIKFVTTISGASGSTSLEYASSNRFSAVRMSLARVSPSTGLPFTAAEREATVFHEFGHSLGIYDPRGAQAHSTNEGDILWQTNSKWAWTTLSKGDTASIQQLYSMSPTIVRQDG